MVMESSDGHPPPPTLVIPLPTSLPSDAVKHCFTKRSVERFCPVANLRQSDLHARRSESNQKRDREGEEKRSRRRRKWSAKSKEKPCTTRAITDSGQFFQLPNRAIFTPMLTNLFVLPQKPWAVEVSDGLARMLCGFHAARMSVIAFGNKVKYRDYWWLLASHIVGR